MSETDLGGMGYGLAGARCALHPEQPATRTCTRCGSFMCSTCAEGGAQTMCPSCLQRLGMEQRFPLNRENWNFSALWDYCFDIFKREWVMLSVAMVVFFGIVFAVQFVTSIFSSVGGAAAKDNPLPFMAVSTIISTVLQQVVNGVMAIGLLRMIFDVLQGHKPDIGRMFSQMHKVGTYLLAMLIIVLMVGIPLGIVAGIVAGLGAAIGWDSAVWIAVGVGVLAIFPLIYYTLPLYLLSAEIANNDDVTAMQAIRNCYAIARDERASIFGVSFVAGLVTIAGMLACCVGMLPAAGLAYLLHGGLYLALRNGANIQAESQDEG